MTVLDIVSVAWLGVRRRALRSALAAASLLIGVVTVVLVQGSGTLIRSATVERALLSAGPATTLSVTINESNEPDAESWWADHLTRLTRDHRAHVTELNRYSSANLRAAGDSIPAMELISVGDDFRAVRPLTLQRGAWLDGGGLTPRVVVNEAAWASMSSRGRLSLVTRDGLETLSIDVVGVADDGTDEPTAYVSVRQADLLARAGLVPITRSLLVASSSVDAGTLSSRVETISQLSGRSGEVGEITRVDQMSQYDDQLETMRRVFLVIAALSLLVGSLGILNIGLATLVERADELSLRRALGATRGQIAAVMLLESQLVAWSAAAGAVALAHLAVPLYLAQVTTVPVAATALPVGAVVLGLVAGASAAVLGAIAPSLRAARVPIASIMR